VHQQSLSVLITGCEIADARHDADEFAVEIRLFEHRMVGLLGASKIKTRVVVARPKQQTVKSIPVVLACQFKNKYVVFSLLQHYGRQVECALYYRSLFVQTAVACVARIHQEDSRRENQKK
jgi:hypothetical protein